MVKQYKIDETGLNSFSVRNFGKGETLAGTIVLLYTVYCKYIKEIKYIDDYMGATVHRFNNCAMELDLKNTGIKWKDYDICAVTGSFCGMRF